MDAEEVLRIFRECGAFLNGHFVYTSGKHGQVYINKDAIYLRPYFTKKLCQAIAEQFADDKVEVIIAPAIGGVILSQWTAYHLSEITGREVFGVYAEKAESGDAFIIKRGYDKVVAGKNILVVEDVLTTGSSAKKVVETTRVLGGNVIGLGALCNRGGVRPEDVANPPKLFALVNVNLDTWHKAECPLCANGVPISVEFGRGV